MARKKRGDHGISSLPLGDFKTNCMKLFMFKAVYSVVVLAQLFKLICVAFLFACITLASFLNDGDQYVVPLV